MKSQLCDRCHFFVGTVQHRNLCLEEGTPGPLTVALRFCEACQSVLTPESKCPNTECPSLTALSPQTLAIRTAALQAAATLVAPYEESGEYGDAVDTVKQVARQFEEYLRNG
jgi:hypothetical protein